jgi:hypothetical protein
MRTAPRPPNMLRNVATHVRWRLERWMRVSHP